ncbi:LIM and calponin homology domains-containing protein 1a isoform 4-T4 [Syngnathus typhle]
MASTPAGRDVRPESAEASRPEPACLEAQKWIEAVTGKSFGDKDFRSALENGILLCELLSAIRPGLVKKINRLPTPIAGLDNLSVFLRGCEELGLKGSQLFDPGDLQDTSIRANLKDSDCSRKLKNVLNTVFWLAKAAGGCASYSGPTLDLKEFEALLANMKDSDEAADGSQKRSVRDSGYDCWDSERSDSLSPPRHTRDNSLDSLDSFGSRSQHSPSPDVANRGNVEASGRDGDPEADGGRRPDVQKDDMSARRAASGEARTPVLFNQFLPNRSNAGFYALNAKRRPHAEDREQRSLTDGGQPSQVTSPGSPEVPRSPAELDAGLAQYERNLKEEEEEEDEEERIPDIHKDDMMARRTGVFHKQSASSASYNRFLPLPASKYKAQVTDPGAKEVEKNIRAEEGIIPIEHSPQSPDESKNDDDANEPLANPKKDDMMVRRKRWIEKSSPGFRQFLPVPAGVLQNNTVQSCATKQTAKRVEKMASESGGLRPLEKPPKKEIVDEQKEKTANVTNVASSQPRLDDVLPPSEEAGLGKVNKMADPPTTKDSWVGDDDLPPMMSSRRVALMSEDPESVSMSDMVDQDEAGHLPQLSLSRYERMHEQYNDFQDEDDQWQSDLARWKNRRRCASQELIKKEEERKRMERMNGEAGDKRKSIKTYKEIVEDKERREAELCEAYRSAATPEEAAMVLQRYALRFTISDATLDFLNLPRPAANPDATRKTVCEDPEPQSTQRKTCEDLRRRAEKDPPTSELSPKSHQPPGPASPSKPEAATKADAEPRPKPPKPKPSPKPALPSTLPPPPVKPVPLLAAKPYRQPSSTRGVKMDGLVRVNGDTETSPLRSPSEKKLLVTQAEKETSSTSESRDTSPPPQPATASSSSSSSSASSSSTISSLFSGRNCVTKTTIVTELTQTLVEPHAADGHSQVTVEKAAEGKPSLSSSSSTSITSMHCPSVSDGQDESSMSIETPMLNLAKRVNHWVWDPNEERKRVERWQQEQERFLKEQYQKEQEKLKKEWEKAQLEVQEEERKHNEEERKILEETVAPLSPCVRTTSPPAGDKTTSIPPQQNGHKDTKGSEEQHASRLQFLQDAAYDSEPAKKSEMWKTASLDRNTQPNAPHGVKRCDSHDGIAGTGTQQPSSPLPPSPSRCVSGKRQCSGCSQPLGKGAAMIIETLGLYFHMQCFKCGLCEGQLGDATAGTDVRIRNGLLSCHHCYLATRGQGQPTTL